VSNSEATLANSSSASGSFLPLTSLTSTRNDTSWPARSPAPGPEGVVEREDLAGALAGELGVQLVPELARADRVEMVGTGGLGDLLAVHGRVQVDDDVVALPSRAVRETVSSSANRSRSESR
jgi:hypothetical protein